MRFWLKHESHANHWKKKLSRNRKKFKNPVCRITFSFLISRGHACSLFEPVHCWHMISKKLIPSFTFKKMKNNHGLHSYIVGHGTTTPSSSQSARWVKKNEWALTGFKLWTGSAMRKMILICSGPTWRHKSRKKLKK